MPRDNFLSSQRAYTSLLTEAAHQLAAKELDRLALVQLIAESELTPGIKASEYAARREALLSLIPSASTAIIPAATGAFMTGHIPYPYRQAGHFRAAAAYRGKRLILCHCLEMHRDFGAGCGFHVLDGCDTAKIDCSPWRSKLSGSRLHSVCTGTKLSCAPQHKHEALSDTSV